MRKNRIVWAFVLCFLTVLVSLSQASATSSSWVQTTKADFEQGQLNGVDTATSPGDVLLARSGPVTPSTASAEVPLADPWGNLFSSVDNPGLAIDGNTTTVWQGKTGYITPKTASAEVPLADPWGNLFSSVDNPGLAIDGNTTTVWQGKTGYITPETASAEVNSAHAARVIDGSTWTEWQGAAENPWIKFDLGESRRVSGFRQTSGAYPGNPYVAYVSTDDVNYTQVASGTLTQNAWGQVSFPVRFVRYFKLYIQRTDAEGYGELTEFNARVEEAWIKFDLGEIRKTVFGFRQTSGAYPGNPYVAYVSTDDVNYTQVASGTLTQNAWGQVSFPVRFVRYFKLYVQRTDAEGYSELAEFNARVDNAWIKFDLGGIRKVSGFRQTSGAYPGNPYVAYVSTDDVNYTQVASGTLTQNAWGEVSFPVMDVRYFKLYVQRTDATGYSELAEFKARVEEYVPSGMLTSSVYNAGARVNWGSITWNATLPAGTTIKVETRSSQDNISWSSWQEATNGGEVPSPDSRYIQYRATLRTTNLSVTPTLHDVTIIYTLVNQVPMANNLSVTTNEDIPLAITLSASDPEGDPLTFSIVSGPSHGSLSGTVPNLTYVPSSNYNGSDSFTYKANDGYLDSNMATVTITVNAVNDAPVANSQSVTTAEDSPIAITLTGSDVDGDAISFSVISGPSHGSLSGTVPNLTYVPSSNYNGSDSFTYKANDGYLDSNMATVTITVNPVNDPPVANSQSVTTAEDSPIAITLTGSDVDGDAISFSVIPGPSHGSLSGTAPNLTYTPNPNYNGPDSFTYKANDGTAYSNIATVTITVNAVNDAPVANSQSVTTAEDSPIAITLTGSDVDGDAISFSVISGPSHGSLSGTAPNLTYTPNPNYNGPDSFTYKANDGTADSNVATVSITVTAVNDPPVLGLITAPVDPIQVNTAINASASFTDPDVGDTHTAVWEWGNDNTSAGTVDEASGSVAGGHTYTTAGVYTLKLTLKDGLGISAQSVFYYVVVYDPSAGFVTGGGWINSPAGAYVPNPSLTGKANFGFVAKYQKGTTAPTGKTEFQFKVAGLNFHSDSYQWLVIAGAKAQYKGVGTINGAGEYGFMLTAIDGQISGGDGTDKFRMKIWDKATGNIIYDNQMDAAEDADPTTAISGGSIVIHKE